MKKLLLSLLCGGITMGAAAQTTRVIAHRGYWDTEGSAQNSIASLKKADEIGAYGSEFDVRMTSDGVLVINHDETIDGHEIETSPYAAIRNARLKNGEMLSTLDEYLAAGSQNKYAKLILELKPHVRKENEDRAAKMVLEMVKEYGMQDRVEYISFSMNVCEKLMKDRTAKVAFLYSPYDKGKFFDMGEVELKKLKDMGFDGIDYHHVAYENNPNLIKDAKKLGLKVNVWTVNDPDKMRYFIEQGVDFITTDKPVELEALITKQ